jgi:thioredoxin reductase (NADPH)
MSDRMDQIRSTRSPTLREDQIEILERYGQTRKTQVGDVLFRAGDTSNDFIVILEGVVEVIDDFAGERTIGVFLSGRFLGELNMLTGQAMYLIDRIADAQNVEFLANTEIRELLGEDRLEGIVVEDNRSGALRTLGARALFVFIGAEANTGWLRGAVELDERGLILTGEALDRSALDGDVWRNLSREPYPLETSLPGVFAAGDVRSGSIKRVASAVGEGAMAARLVHQYLANAGVQEV